MNPLQLEGMQARAKGSRRSSNPYAGREKERHEWFTGYDLMDVQINQLLRNARQMIDGMRQLSDAHSSRLQLA